MRKIILDTETTGLTPDKDNIIEIAMIELNENNGLTGKIFHSYINPQATIPRIATKVHGISWHTIKNAPTFDDIKADIIDFIQDKEIISYYLSFNLKMLNYKLKYDLNNPTLDLLSFARQRFSPEQCSMQSLVKLLKIKLTPLFNHTLLQDCYTAWEIYQKSIHETNHTNPLV